MTASACPRSWEVEAARDGRLRGNDLASALRHRAQCAECSAEERALSELGHRLANLPTAVADPLTMRRARQRLLRRWNDHLLHSPAPSRPRRGALIVALGAALVAVAVSLLVSHSRSPAHDPQPSAARPKSLLEITGAPDARWVEQLSVDSDRVELSQGFASFNVSPHGAEHVIIALPDGELEDLGTVFDVEVRDRRTLRIAVHAGRVSVRLHGRASFELTAGESWAAESTTALDDALPSAQSLSPKPPEPPLLTPAARAAPARQKPALLPSAAVQTPSASADTAEDDAYLHIVDLLRNGHSAEAKVQARGYLARFPSGFRRPEVERVLDH
ncbi:MAG: FecR domain-containing protein [Polyangiaceae bacterium]